MKKILITETQLKNLLHEQNLSNREKLELELQNAPSELKSELDYFMDTYEDDPDYNIVDAFQDAADLAEEDKNSKIDRICKQIQIKIGYAVPVTGTVHFGPKYWFKYKGIKYEPVDSWDKWITD